MIATILAMMAMTGSAQEIAVSQQHLDAIWSAADARMAQQTDVWFDDGEFPSIIQVLYMRSDLNPKDYEIATDLGWMLENVEEDEKAIAVYEEFAKKNPSNSDAKLPVAQHYFLKKNYAKVIEVLEPGIGDSAHPNNFRILAHAYDRVGRLKESLAMWERYVKLNPDDAPAKVNLERVRKKVSGNTGTSRA